MAASFIGVNVHIFAVSCSLMFLMKNDPTLDPVSNQCCVFPSAPGFSFENQNYRF